ncbi:B-cell scaffold protein with ankyrin repeats-like [Onychomys torridus]|uniref:B-cell scaffold protein with ankyrin repeats-like n=1 Tax=Onychomys torridus TaxID=38674 RepID=UPI00167FCE10|nr:B-cell scaffold protein with ankyrin repeats-like [Onychomys torridus]
MGLQMVEPVMQTGVQMAELVMQTGLQMVELVMQTGAQMVELVMQTGAQMVELVWPLYYNQLAINKTPKRSVGMGTPAGFPAAAVWTMDTDISPMHMLSSPQSFTQQALPLCQQWLNSSTLVVDSMAVQIQNISRNNEQENDYEEDVTTFSTCSPSPQSPAFHHELRKTHRQSTDISEEPERSVDTEEEEPGAESRSSLPEVEGESSENQYDDLYVFIPGIDAESNSQEPLPYCRPPPPPPRSGTAASQLERPHFTSQGKMVEDQMERSQNWSDLSVRQETREEPSKEEKRGDESQKEEEEENPYAFAETDDNEYDLILASKSIKKRTGNHSFIINRPPAPTPRPTHIPFKEETTPYIAQVFQQKAARRQSDDDKFYSLPKKPDKAWMEGPTVSSAKGYLTTGQEELILGQEELILLQEKVKNGKMSVDEALEKFKRWQMGKSSLEMIQQEKLRQLRDNIIGKRPEDENAYDKLTIVHHPSGNNAHSENTLYNNPFNNKFPARLQVEKEFGFCCKKDH